MNHLKKVLDYNQIFRKVPGLFLILEPNEHFTIVDASDAYLEATLTRREEIIGKPLFVVFPDNPEEVEATGVSNLRKSLQRAIKAKKRT